MSDPYPEHTKLKRVSGTSQAIGEFVDWMGHEKKISLCASNGHQFYPAHIPISRLLAEHFGIDEQKLEDEKLAMLEECRKLNERTKS